MPQVDPASELMVASLLLVLVSISYSCAPQLRFQSNMMPRYMAVSEDFMGFSKSGMSRGIDEYVRPK